MKKLNLPGPIAAYFEADKRDAQAVAQCFTQDGVVKDEGKTYVGTEEIEGWKTAASRQFSYSAEPFAFEEKGGKSVVSGKVTGDFPGSPVVLQYIFSLEHGKIQHLEVTP